MVEVAACQVINRPSSTSCRVGQSWTAVWYFLHASSSSASFSGEPTSGPALSALSCQKGVFDHEWKRHRWQSQIKGEIKQKQKKTKKIENMKHWRNNLHDISPAHKQLASTYDQRTHLKNQCPVVQSIMVLWIFLHVHCIPVKEDVDSSDTSRFKCTQQPDESYLKSYRSFKTWLAPNCKNVHDFLPSELKLRRYVSWGFDFAFPILLHNLELKLIFLESNHCIPLSCKSKNKLSGVSFILNSIIIQDVSNYVCATGRWPVTQNVIPAHDEDCTRTL